MQVIFVPVADRPECAKALKTAFDFGNRVDAEVVTIITAGTEDRLGPKSTHLATYLRHLRLAAERVEAGRNDDAMALLDAHRDLKADLPVMGAYSRSRPRQRIFGGVSDYMLNWADIPVLVPHS